MPRTLDCLDDSRLTRILCILLLEHMTVCINSFQRSLFEIQDMLYGRFISNTRALDACIPLLPLLGRHSICIFCSLWSKVRE